MGCFFTHCLRNSGARLSALMAVMFIFLGGTPAVVVIKTLRTIVCLAFIEPESPMTTGNVPVNTKHYEKARRDMAVHRSGTGQDIKICGVHTEILFKHRWTEWQH